MKKHTLFSYRFLVYRIGKGGGGATLAAGPSTGETADAASAKQDVTRVEKSLVERATKVGKEYKKEFTSKDNEVVQYVMTKAIDIRVSFQRQIVGKSPKQIAALKNTALNKLRELALKLKEVVEVHQQRKDLLGALDSHLKQTYDEYTKKWYKFNKTDKKNCWLQHVHMMVMAYGVRWKKVNAKAIKNVSRETIKHLYLDLNDKKLFTKGQILGDLTDAKGQIDKAIAYWKRDIPRKVYKDSDWDTDWKDGLSQLEILKFQFEGKPPRYQVLMQNPPPLPDWGGRGKDAITSPLADPSQAQAYLKALKVRYENNLKEIKDKLTKVNEAKGLKDKAVQLAKKLGGIKSKLKFEGHYNDKTRNGSVVITDRTGNPLGVLEVTKDNKILFYKMGSKKGIDVTSNLKNLKSYVASLELSFYTPNVTSLAVKSGKSGNPELLIKGENLPKKAIPVDLNLGVHSLRTGLRSGKTGINLPPAFGKLGGNIRAAIKQALTVASLPFVHMGPQVLKKLDTKKVEKLKNLLFPKGALPQIIVTGTASMDGNFARNKKLALNRAKAAKLALINKNPKIRKQLNKMIVLKPIVVGPKKNPITNIATARKAMVEEYNKTIVAYNKTHKQKPRQKVNTWKDLMARLKRPTIKEDRQFAKTNFDDNRGAHMVVLPPKNKPKAFAMNFETPTSSPA